MASDAPTSPETANEALSFTIRFDTRLDWSSVADDGAKNSGDPKHRTMEALAVRFGALLGNSLRSDMSFYVEHDNVSIPAHRLIVGSASAVLEAMVYGSGIGTVRSSGDGDSSTSDGTDTAGRGIPVRDCYAEDFYEVLRFLYIGDVQLNESNAAAILMLAHYFDLSSLGHQCITFLLQQLSLQNVCTTFGATYLLTNELTQKCLSIIQENTDQLFAVEQSIFDLDVDALALVLRLDWLCIDSEVQLFDEMLKWARHRIISDVSDEQQPAASSGSRHCPTVPTVTMLRSELEGRLDLIRFSNMTYDQFGECLQLVEPTFFTNEEIATTFMRILKNARQHEISLPWYSVRRQCIRYEDWSLDYGDIVGLNCIAVNHLKFETPHYLKFSLKGLKMACFTSDQLLDVAARFTRYDKYTAVPHTVDKLTERVVFHKPLTTSAAGQLLLKLSFKSKVHVYKLAQTKKYRGVTFTSFGFSPNDKFCAVSRILCKVNRIFL